MKKEAGVLLAGGIGLLAVLSFIGVKKILSKKHKKYSDYYSDHHRHFDKKYDDDDHGIEGCGLRGLDRRRSELLRALDERLA